MEDEVEEEENEDSTSTAFERSIIQIFGFSLTFGFSLEQMEHGFSLTFGFSLEQMEHDRCWFLFENVHALQTQVVMSNVLTMNTRSTSFSSVNTNLCCCFIVLIVMNQTTINLLTDQVDLNRKNFDGFFYAVTAIFVFLMQLGFALLEAGTVRSKNVKSALLKNVLDLCVAALCWYIIGNALSGAGSTELHYHKTGLLNTRGNYNPEALTNLQSFVIMYGFLATATTIVSGAILSRLNLYVYLISSMVMSIFIYPIGAFWMWNRAGWLYRLGAVDNAGGVVVHVCGGSAALVSAYIAGPRAGRFMRVGATWIDRSVDPHSSVLQFMGINMLWVGWMAFNGASLYQDGGIVLVERAMRNTLLGGTAGFIGAFIFAHCGAEPVYPARRKFLVPSLTGILGGLAGTTSNCGVVDAWAALFIGFISSIAAAKSSALLSKYRIDDPVEAAPVHLVGGAVGMICTGLFATDTTIKIIRGPDAPVGLFYSSFFDLRLLGIQLLSVLVYCTWSMLFTSATLLLLKKLIGKDKFTYSRKAQILGLDYSTDGDLFISHPTKYGDSLTF